jgi:hypothetical protein
MPRSVITGAPAFLGGASEREFVDRCSRTSERAALFLGPLDQSLASHVYA